MAWQETYSERELQTINHADDPALIHQPQFGNPRNEPHALTIQIT